MTTQPAKSKMPLPLKGGGVAKPQPVSREPIKEMTLDDVEPGKANRIAIVGPSGSGKTWLAATWPQPAFIDADYNIETLKQEAWRKYAGGHKRVVISQIKDDVDKKGLFVKASGFWDMLDKINEWSERDDVKTIVIDSLTAVSTMAMHVGLEVAGADKRSQTLKEANTKYSVYLLTQADFGAEMSVMEQLLDQLPLLNLDNKTVICTAHVRTEKNKDGNILGYRPLITGDKHREKFGSWFNEVWWLESRGSGDNVKRVLTTQSDTMRQGIKTTLGLPREIENPTYSKIMGLIK